MLSSSAARALRGNRSNILEFTVIPSVLTAVFSARRRAAEGYLGEEQRSGPRLRRLPSRDRGRRAFLVGDRRHLPG